MMKVVAERNEMEYCSCRDISSREASMQLSLMVGLSLSLSLSVTCVCSIFSQTPADNNISITFHYKTDFSLRRNLSSWLPWSHR